MATPDKFLKESEEKAFSDKHRKTIAFNIGKYDAKVKLGKQQFSDLEKARQLSKNLKWFAIENLPRLLVEFERKFQERGGKVIWALDKAEAQAAIVKIMQEKAAKTVVKSKSMITEEIELNHLLEKNNVEVLETDLGEFIVQQKNEPPYHIVTPAMHMSKEDIAELFHEKFNTDPNATPEELTGFARRHLRQKFQQADVGITGGNFIIADTGSIVLVENEGNARLSTALPKTHIAIVGIEKMLASIEHLQVFLPLLATYGTGQQLTVYNSVLSGPRQEGEADGPDEMYVILLDNGRSNILADPKQRQSLYCIRCGSCLNACPIYKNIGGHTYETPYSGPIGSVIMPNLQGLDNHGHLSNASSLCGNCSASCPVHIDLHHMLLYNRQNEKEQGLKEKAEDRMWWGWKKGMLNRRLMNAPRFGKNLFAKLFLQKKWGDRRIFPDFPKHTFNQLWKKKKV